MRLAWAVAFAAAPVLSHEAFAQGAGRSGKDVVDAVCITCHGTGAQGAPKIGDRKAWDKRASQGLTSLTEHALKGIRQMPAHGGSPGLTDLEIARAITYMVNQSGGRWVEPVSAKDLAAERSGEQIVTAQCQVRKSGEGGAPRDRRPGGLDTAAEEWPRQPGAPRSGAWRMPARGMATRRPTQIGAVSYMFNPAGAVAAGSQ
jgi:cytochrome c5